MKYLVPIFAAALVIAVPAAYAGEDYKDGGSVSMHCDANHDGKVTMDEHRAASDACFEKTDANKDGVVTQDEITKACPATKGDVEHDRTKDGQEIGDKYDKDKVGDDASQTEKNHNAAEGGGNNKANDKN